MKRFPLGSTSSASTSSRSRAWSMRARAWMLFALVPVWALAGTGCYSAGQSASRGAFDEGRDALGELHAWWDETGKGEAKVLAAEASTAAIDAAAATFQKRIEEARTQLQAEWKGRVEDLERKVAEGRATPIEFALWVLLGGLGAGGTKTVLERLLIGKRAAASGSNGGM